MDHTSQYSGLSRLLDLNNQVHDLEKQILREPVPLAEAVRDAGENSPSPSHIASMQEEIDRGGRASLVTCWFGLPN
jgi:hypothetical protein